MNKEIKVTKVSFNQNERGRCFIVFDWECEFGRDEYIVIINPSFCKFFAYIPGNKYSEYEWLPKTIIEAAKNCNVVEAKLNSKKSVEETIQWLCDGFKIKSDDNNKMNKIYDKLSEVSRPLEELVDRIYENMQKEDSLNN